MKRQKKSRITKTILKQVNKKGRVTLHNTKAYYLAAMIQTVGTGGETHRDQLNRTENKNDPYKYSQLIFYKSAKNNTIPKPGT